MSSNGKVPDRHEVLDWQAQLRRAMFEELSGDTIREVVRAIVERAKKGDIQAARLLLTYAVGNPVVNVRNAVFVGEGQQAALPSSPAKALPSAPERSPPRILPPASSVHKGIDLAEYDSLVCKLAIQHGANKAAVRESEEYSDGCMGLVYAADHFQPERGVVFMTYAFKCVRGYILRGRRQRRGRGNAAWKKSPQLSQLGDVEEGGYSDIAVSADPLPDIDDIEIISSYLRCLDRRTQRLIEKVVMGERSLKEVGMEESPPISRARVEQLVKKGLARIRRLRPMPDSIQD